MTRQRDRGIERDCGCSHARFGRQEREHVVRGIDSRWFGLQRLPYTHQRFCENGLIEWERGVFANAGAHQLHKQLWIAGPADSDHLRAWHILLDLAHRFVRLRHRLGAYEDHLRRVRTEKAQQLLGIGIVVHRTSDSDNSNVVQNRVEPFVKFDIRSR